jgi:hypothetical protein
MIFGRILLAALAALAVAAPSARAADAVVATTARPTPLTTDGGDLLYSAWDGTSYRLTLLAGGVTTTLPVAGAATPFQADLGPGPSGHELVVYPRCAHGVFSCDLHAYDRTTRTETAI